MNTSYWLKQIQKRIFPTKDLQEIALMVVHENFDDQVTRSGLVRILSQVIQFFIFLLSGMIFARLLSPKDFGIFAMVNSVIAFVNSFRDFGLPLATLHSEKIQHAQINALFWLNLRLNRWLFLVLILIAPLVAKFYHEPIVLWMVMLMAVGIFILGLSSQHELLISRQMRFGTLALIDLTSTIIGFVVGLFFAMFGPDVWALVIVLFTTMITRSLGMWLGCWWRPNRQHEHVSTKTFTRYSKDAVSSKTIAHLGRNMDRVVVGYFLGAQALGLYRNAYKWSTIASRQIYSPVLYVAVSSLSRVKGNAQEFQRIARLLMLPMFAISTPILIFLAIDARAALLFLFGNQWVEAVPMFRVFCIAALVNTLDLVTDWLYLSFGQTHRQLLWTMFYTPVVIGAVFFGALNGVYGIALMFSVTTILMTPISLYVCLQVVPLRWLDYIQTLWRPVLATSMAMIFWFIVKMNFHDSSMIIRGIVYFSTYCITFLLLPNSYQLLKESYGSLSPFTNK